MVTTEQLREYADRGWSILPISQGKKNPAMQSWTEYGKRAATLPQLETWFNAMAGAGVGVVTGQLSDLAVIDMESTCPTRVEDVLKAYPTGLVSHTGGGGYHLFYRYPKGNRISNKVRIFDGVDIRGDNGFIVLPPTRHPSGNLYEWVSTGQPGVFPDALIDTVQKETRKAADSWVTKLLRGVGEGERNQSCARLAGYFASKAMPKDITMNLLIDWNARNMPPMDMLEVSRTVDSVYTGFHGNIALKEEEKITSDTGVDNQFDLASFSSYAQRFAMSDNKWLIQDWLVDKSITFIVSPPESYKTWLLLDLAVSVAMGSKFLGKFDVENQGSVFIIQQEDAPAALVERISLITQKKLGYVPYKENAGAFNSFIMPDLPIYFHTSRMLKFGDLNVLNDVEEHIAKIRPRLILIDPLYSTTDNADNYMNDLASKMMILKDWRDRYGCSFVIAHHSRKSAGAEEMEREDAWGSQFINAFLEAGWQIRRDPRSLRDNEIYLRRHSKVTGNQPTTILSFDISTVYPYEYKVRLRDPSARAEAGQPDVDLYTIIEEADKPLSAAELSRLSGLSSSTTSRMLRTLMQEMRIVQLPNGKFCKKLSETT